MTQMEQYIHGIIVLEVNNPNMFGPFGELLVMRSVHLYIKHTLQVESAGRNP